MRNQNGQGSCNYWWVLLIKVTKYVDEHGPWAVPHLRPNPWPGALEGRETQLRPCLVTEESPRPCPVAYWAPGAAIQIFIFIFKKNWIFFMFLYLNLHIFIFELRRGVVDENGSRKRKWKRQEEKKMTTWEGSRGIREKEKF